MAPSTTRFFRPGDALTTFYTQKSSTATALAARIHPRSASRLELRRTGQGRSPGKLQRQHCFEAPSLLLQVHRRHTNVIFLERITDCPFFFGATLPPANQCFAVQRSLNGSGTPTGTYVTIWAAGTNFSRSDSGEFWLSAVAVLFHRSLSGPAESNTERHARLDGHASDNNFAFAASSAFNNGIPFSNAQPCVGLWDYPCTAVGVAATQDITEGVTFFHHKPIRANHHLYADQDSTLFRCRERRSCRRLLHRRYD